MRPSIVISVLPGPAQPPKAMVIVLGAKIMSDKSPSGAVSILNWEAAVKQLRVPYQHVSCVGYEHRGLRSTLFEFAGDVPSEIRHLSRDRVCSAVGEKEGRNLVASGVV